MMMLPSNITVDGIESRRRQGYCVGFFHLKGDSEAEGRYPFIHLTPEEQDTHRRLARWDLKDWGVDWDPDIRF